MEEQLLDEAIQAMMDGRQDEIFLDEILALVQRLLG